MNYVPGKPPAPPPELKLRKPAVVLQPKTYHDLQTGVNLIVKAIRPTLGPLPRTVLMEGLRRGDLPEFLDDGATIARRIIQIKPRGWDVGAMLIREALWKMHEEVGDGTATMAVIYQTILNEGIRYITQFGCNAMLLRSGLERGLQTVIETIRQESMLLYGKENITKIARGICQGDVEMADVMGEIFDIVGEDGLIIVEGWNKWGVEREYIEGTYWDLSGWFSRLLVTDSAEKRTVFEDAAILISDLEIKDPNQLVPVLEKCAKGGIKKLVIIAKELSDSAIGLLVNNNRAKTIQSLAVRTPRMQEMGRVASMEDIAALTGGKIFYSAATNSFSDFQVEDLGHARRAWANESLFGVFGGKGDPRRIRQHIVALRGMLSKTEERYDKEMLQKRLGRLLGGTAIFRVGALTDHARETRKNVAERAVTSLRNALRGGVIPGGGTALLNARSALEGLPARNEDEAIAYKILARALEEPMRAIVKNAGYVPDVIIEKVKASPKGYGFEARSGKIADMKQAGILDASLTVQNALKIAVGGAAMTLTTDVIVLHKKPVETIVP